MTNPNGLQSGGAAVLQDCYVGGANPLSLNATVTGASVTAWNTYFANSISRISGAGVGITDRYYNCVAAGGITVGTLVGVNWFGGHIYSLEVQGSGAGNFFAHFEAGLTISSSGSAVTVHNLGGVGGNVSVTATVAPVEVHGAWGAVSFTGTPTAKRVFKGSSSNSTGCDFTGPGECEVSQTISSFSSKVRLRGSNVHARITEPIFTIPAVDCIALTHSLILLVFNDQGAGTKPYAFDASSHNNILIVSGVNQTGVTTPGTDAGTNNRVITETSDSILADYLPKALTETHIFVGDAADEAADVAMSGDATIDNAGAVSVNRAHLTDQTAPSAPADGVILQSIDHQGFSFPHVFDANGNAIEILRDSLVLIRNVSGGTLTKGTPVYITGSNGVAATVAKAKADSFTTLPCAGLIYEAVANNAYGRMIMRGYFENVNLSAYSDGDTLYVSAATAGTLTATRPTAPNIAQAIGVVVDNDGSTGIGFVRIDSLNHGHSAVTVIVDSTTLVGVGTDVQAVLEELDNGIADHLADTSDAHDASAISADSTTLVGTGTDVQAVLEELDNSTATNATDISNHLADTSDAHDASAISADSTTLVGTGTDVQAVLEELDNSTATNATDISNHLADTSDAHDASAISADSTTLVGTGTDVQAVLEELDNGIADHLADTSAAHAASAISVDSTTLVGVGTDVQAVLEELDDAVAAATGAPTGAIMMYGAATAPSGWLLCDGASLLRAGTYAALFAVVGTTFGSADGTHFNVPNMVDRFAYGAGNLGAIGATYAGTTHTHGIGSFAFPNHSHAAGTLTIPTHTHDAGTLALAHTHTLPTLTVDAHVHYLTGGVGTGAGSHSHTHISQHSIGAVASPAGSQARVGSSTWTKTHHLSAAGAGSSGTQAVGETSADISTATVTLSGYSDYANTATITGSGGTTASQNTSAVTGSTGSTISANAVAGSTASDAGAAITGTSAATTAPHPPWLALTYVIKT